MLMLFSRFSVELITCSLFQGRTRLSTEDKCFFLCQLATGSGKREDFLGALPNQTFLHQPSPGTPSFLPSFVLSFFPPRLSS